MRRDKELIYIIGGSGFIGKNLVKCLYEDYQICIFDKYVDEKFFSDYPSVRAFEQDLILTNISTILQTPDYIINLASLVTAERDLSLFDDLVSSNLTILLNLFNRFKDDKRLKMHMQFGSSEEYGSISSPFIETNRENPNSPYALAKQMTSNTAIMLCNNYKFPSMVVRPGNLYGSMQNKQKFIPYIIDCLRRNEPLDVSPCEQKRDFICVDDFSYLIKRILQNYKLCIGEIINVSSGESLSLKDVIEWFRIELKSSSLINYGAIPYRENEIMDLLCSVRKLSRLIKEDISFDNKKRFKELLNNN